MTIPHAVLSNSLLNSLRQTTCKRAYSQVAVRIKLWKFSFFTSQLNGRVVSSISHAFCDAYSHSSALIVVVSQAKHGQCITHTCKAHSNTPLGYRLIVLLRQWPKGDVQHIIQCSHLYSHRLLECFKVKHRNTIKPKGMTNKTRKDDRPQIAASIRR